MLMIQWCLLSLLTTVAFGLDERTHDITEDDYQTISNIGEIVTSPDGSHVVYTESRWEVDRDTRNTDLWVVSASAPEQPKRLTFQPSGEGSPKWDPTSKWIYFTSSRKEGEGKEPPYNGKTQVWRMTIDAGSIQPVTRVPEGIDQYQLSSDGRSVYYTVSKERHAVDRWTEMRKQNASFEYGHGTFEGSEVWKLDLATWRCNMLVSGYTVIKELRVSPDERFLALVTAPDNKLASYEGWSQVDIYDVHLDITTRLPSEQWREQAPSPYGWILNSCWSSDGAQLAFRVDFDGFPGEIFVCHFGDDGPGKITKIKRPNEVTATGPIAYRPGTHDLVFTGEDHARNRVYTVHKVSTSGQGDADTTTPGDYVISDFSFSADAKTLAILHNGRTHPPDIFLLPEAGVRDSLLRLTRSNPQVDTWKLPLYEIVEWTSPDGTKVEGILELPPGYEPGSPLPLLVAIHGGPTAADHYAFRYWIYGRTLFAARGWATFCPNYRGSTGYGDKFLTDLIGNKNNLDVQDILSGVDALVERGIADPDRLAVSGWSNGGYLTNCLITTTDRFKAASSGAGVFDTVMQWEIEDTPGHVVNYSQGLPWEKAAKMHQTSPLYKAHKITTPTLIHVGENDERVPAEHSRALHRSLHRYLNVPTELVVYPGASHGLSKYSQRLAKLKWDLEWLDHYVLGKDGGS